MPVGNNLLVFFQENRPSPLSLTGSITYSAKQPRNVRGSPRFLKSQKKTNKKQDET